MDREALEILAKEIVDAAFAVHSALGAGLLESSYEMALCHEFKLRGIEFERQKEMPVTYKGVALDCGYRMDILVADEIVLELKAVEATLPIHEAQILSYLKHAGKPLGFLINFNVALIKDGIRRRALRLPLS